MKKILIADDEPDILEFLSYNLKKENFDVSTASNGIAALKLAKKIIPDLIILDVMMPEMDGIETCRKLREIEEFKNTYIIFLSARAEDYTQIMGLESGADDYIVKPIKPSILTTKIKALFRRTESVKENNILINGLDINKDRYSVKKDSIEINFPKKEFDLLYLLASKPNKIFTRDEIYTKIWGNEIIVGDRTIDVHIKKIRDKIGNDIIKTIKGVGYKFDNYE